MHASRLLPVICVLTFFPCTMLAGNDGLPMPREIQRAFDRGTRAMDGAPGPKYWQNSADYDITVSVNPVRRFLDGKERILYTNHSPDSMRTLVFRLYQNLNLPTAPRGTSLGTKAITDGMRIHSLGVDGVERSLLPGSEEVRIDHTVMYVRLPKPLAPGGQTTVDVAWSFTIPVNTGEGGGNPRMGAYENGAVFLAYWFPRIAVYDDVRGWDLLPHDGEHEFYHDYGDMRVAITVPDSCGVWATGTLSNPEEVLRDPWLARYRAASSSDTVLRIVDGSDVPYVRNARGNTWKFSATKVPDFAFGVAAGYRWDAVGAEVEDRRVLVDAAYDPASTSFRTVAEESKAAVEMLSSERPGIPFPYPAITVFNGNHGMEFPMIVNDGVFGNRITDVYVHVHEIAHSYFPFLVGVNETRYAWMDEGMAYFLPVDIQKHLTNYDHMIRAARSYERFAGTEMDYPMMLPSVASSGDNLQIIGYLKPALAFGVLRDMLGEERFDSALRTFMRNWEGRHPLPWDFFHTFNTATGERLDWFWRAWFFEHGMPDLGIAAVKQEQGGTKVVIHRKGSMPIPVKLLITGTDGSTRTLHRSAAVWADGSREITVELPGGEDIRSIRLGGEWIPDAQPADNTWPRS